MQHTHDHPRTWDEIRAALDGDETTAFCAYLAARGFDTDEPPETLEQLFTQWRLSAGGEPLTS